MKEFYKKCVCNLVYGGIEKEEYLQIKDDISEENRRSLSAVSLCLFLMFVALFFASLFSELMAPNRTAYGVVGLCFLAIWLLARSMKGEGKRFIILLWYVAVTMICAYGIVLNTVISPNTSATTFCIIMVVAPLLFTDQPWRVFVYFAFVTVFFVLFAFRQKMYNLAFTDMVNSICCIFIGSVSHFRIIRTKRRELLQRQKIEKDRDTDKLTGCMTKAAFETQMKKRLGSVEKNGVLLVIDIDRFKNINDSYGHIYGDMVLRRIGNLLHSSFHDGTVFGRFGGDEFQVWLPGIYEKKEIMGWLDDLLKGVNAINTPDKKIKIGISIGVAICPQNGTKYRMLFENADAALYSAKSMGRNRYVFCQTEGKE